MKTTMESKNVILTGATGMIGGLALADCLSCPKVGRVTSIVRRSSGLVHEKLREIVHGDFLDYAAILDAFQDQDAALFCLGSYTGRVPAAELRAITVDYPRAFAEALRRQSPRASFCLLSGAGADPSEKSRIQFARDKGTAENALLALGFERLYLFRPGYIYPVTRRREPNLGYLLLRPLYPVLRRIYPDVGIESDALARAMVDAGLDGLGGPLPERAVLENRDIRALASRRPRVGRPGRHRPST